jgi:dihydrofolate reductase
VATSSPEVLEWENSIRISGDIAKEVRRLKNQDGPLLQIHGSWQLIQTLLSNDLIDEFRLWIFPVLLGSGKRLFDQGTMPASSTLTRTDRTPGGVAMNFYRLGPRIG